MLLKPPQPIQYPDVVYKYRDWDNDFHKRILLNHELFLSSPKHFNDPFDCKLTIANFKLKEDNRLALDYFTQYAKRHYPEKSETDQMKLV